MNSTKGHTPMVGHVVKMSAAIVLVLQTTQPTHAQGEDVTIPGITRQPSAAAREALLDPNDTVVLLLDHQTGLFQTVTRTTTPQRAS